MNTPEQNQITISTQREKLDLNVIMNFMHEHSYWARNRDPALMRKAMDNSLCFGIFVGEKMVGFARAITDYATMYYLCDVFISPEHQGKGLGKKLVRTVLDAPELKELYGILLTKDAHDLYRKFGFENQPEAFEKFMIKREWPY